MRARHILAVLFTIVAACGGEKPRDEARCKPGLPQEDGSAAGIEPIPAPTACAYALAADALVLARVVAVRPSETFWTETITFPESCSSPPMRTMSLEDHCDDGSGLIGLALDLEVLRTFAGAVPAQLTAYIGSERARFLSPRDVSGVNQDAYACDPASGLRELAAGAELGFALRYNADQDVWSPLFEPMFEFQVNDAGESRSAMQPETGLQYSPPELAGLTEDEFASLIAACDASSLAEAQRRRDLFHRSWMSIPTRYFASACYPYFTVPDGRCIMNDLNCPDGKTCLYAEPPDCYGYCVTPGAPSPR